MSTAVLFAGQGAHLAELGANLFKNHAWLKKEAKNWSSYIDKDIYALLGDKIAAHDVEAVHIALVSYSLLAYAVLEKNQPNPPKILAGHSLGELSALACAGALSVKDALNLAQVRGRALAKACSTSSGAMLAIQGQDIVSIEKIVLDFMSKNDLKRIYFANYNSPLQIVISGDKSEISVLNKHLLFQGLRTTLLPTSGAFHSPFMHEAAKEVYDYATHIIWQNPKILCMSSMHGRILNAHDTRDTHGAHSYAAHCALQIISPVRWVDLMQNLQRASIHSILEVGSGGIFGRMCKDMPLWDVQSTCIEDLYE